MSMNTECTISLPSHIKNAGGRSSGIELLRILCMFCIIMSHYLGHGISVIFDNDPQWAVFVYPLAYIANNAFFLITGWFLLKTKFSFKKLVSLVSHILILNYILLLVNLVVFRERSLTNIVKQIFPITSNLNWFLSVYVFIYAIGPFLKRMILYLRDRTKTFNALIAVLMFFYSCLGFITPVNVYANIMMQGIVIVILGNWIELQKEKLRTYHPGIIALAGYVLAVFFTLCLRFAANYVPVLADFDSHFRSNNSPFIIMAAAGLVVLFSNLNFHSKFVNLIASSVMTTYLIHDNGQFKGHIWFDILRVQNHLSVIVPYMFICAFIVLGSCFLIDLILKNTIHPGVMRFLNRPIEFVSRKLEELGVPY